MNLEFNEDSAGIEQLDAARALLKNLRVEIGLPASAPARLRWLLALQERGAPGAHIPPRPVVGPALARPASQEAIRQGLLEACGAAAEGDPEGVVRGFELAGQAGADSIRAAIDDGLEPPNAPLTVRGGWIRNFVSGRPARVEGKGFNKPLYDTGELYRAFDFEVK